MCGYVRGATTGYLRLSAEERNSLAQHGYEVDINVHGDEIARQGKNGFNSARYELHRVICERPTRFERLT